MKALLFLLSIAAAGLGSWAVFEYTTRIRLEKELSLLTRERNALARTAREKTGLIAGMEIKEDGPRGLRDLGIPLEEEDAKKERRPGPVVPGEKPAEPGGDSAAALKARMEDPSVREALKTQAGARLELEYGPLFVQSGLDAAKQEAVLRILRSRLNSQMELGFKAGNPAASPEERTAAAAALEKSVSGETAKLQELLGAAWDRFARFEQSKPERDHLQSLTSRLKEAGREIDRETAAKLEDAMFEARMGHRFTRDLTGMSPLALPGGLTMEEMDRFLEENAPLQQQIESRARGLLTPDQFRIFLEAREDDQQALQSRLKLWQEMTGGTGGRNAKN